MKRIKTSFKPNFIISLIIGCWLFFFTVLIKPFQLEPIAISQWITMALGYSIIALLGYIAIIPINTTWKIQITVEILFLNADRKVPIM